MKSVSVVAKNVRVGDRINGQIIRQVFRNQGRNASKVQFLVKDPKGAGFRIAEAIQTGRIVVRRPAYNMFKG